MQAMIDPVSILAGIAGGAVVMGLVFWAVHRTSRWPDDDAEIRREIEKWRKGK